MEVFRIVQEKYAEDLGTSGKPNRWNIDGQKVIYAGSSRSLSTLEMVVHHSSIKPTVNYKVVIISIADDDHLFRQIHVNDLPGNWRSVSAYSKLQAIGSNWIKAKETLVLKVPSAVIPKEYNYVINKYHPSFKNNVKNVRAEDYFWDKRIII